MGLKTGSRSPSKDSYYWRTYEGVEVDFVIYGEDSFWAVEYKNTIRVRPQDLRSLRMIRAALREFINVL